MDSWTRYQLIPRVSNIVLASCENIRVYLSICPN